MNSVGISIKNSVFLWSSIIATHWNFHYDLLISGETIFLKPYFCRIRHRKYIWVIHSIFIEHLKPTRYLWLAAEGSAANHGDLSASFSVDKLMTPLRPHRNTRNGYGAHGASKRLSGLRSVLKIYRHGEITEWLSRGPTWKGNERRTDRCNKGQEMLRIDST